MYQSNVVLHELEKTQDIHSAGLPHVILNQPNCYIQTFINLYRKKDIIVKPKVKY